MQISSFSKQFANRLRDLSIDYSYSVFRKGSSLNIGISLVFNDFPAVGTISFDRVMSPFYQLDRSFRELQFSSPHQFYYSVNQRVVRPDLRVVEFRIFCDTTYYANYLLGLQSFGIL